MRPSSTAASCTAKADFMTTKTTFLVQAFSGGKGGHLKASMPVPCRSADGARHRREALLEPFGSRGFLGDVRS